MICVSTAKVLGPVNPLSSDFSEEDWIWDQSNCSPEIRLSQDTQAAYFHINPFLESCGTAGIVYYYLIDLFH